MDDYEFTEAEQAVIEKSAERLEHVMVNLDAIDAAYNIAREIRAAVAVAALGQAAEDVLAHRDELRNIPLAHGDIRREARLRGLEEAAGVVRSRARQSLSRPTAEETQ